MDSQPNLQKIPPPVLMEQHGVSFSGPIPDPDNLKKYKETDPSFPERIMKMAEDYNVVDVRANNRISLSNFIIPIMGQVFTFLLGMSGILACVYLARTGYIGGAVVIGGFIPTIFNTFKQRK